MAAENKGPPDLGDLLLKLIQPLLNLYARFSARVTELQQAQRRQADYQSNDRSRQVPLARSASETVPVATSLSLPAKKPPQRTRAIKSLQSKSKTPPLKVRLRDRDFLRQAIVVNEILAKPVAQRRRSKQRL